MGQQVTVQQMWIGDARVAGPGGRTRDAVNPATGETIGAFAWGDRESAEAAIHAAAAAFPAWSARPAVERGRLLRRVAALLRDRSETLARLMTRENGKVIAESRVEVEAAAAHFDWYADQAPSVYGRTVPPTVPGKRHVVIHQPMGVVAAITPWNFPLMLWARKVAPALAAGCTVVCKPATATMLTTMAGFECCADAGLTGGLANLVTGPASDAAEAFIASDAVRKITFTGSTEVGADLASRAAGTMKRLSLELGGHAPALVLADADLELAARQVAAGKLRNAGQSCIAVNRVYVEAPVADPFIERLCDEMSAYKVADGLDEDAGIGTLINREGLDKVLAHIDDAVRHGARLRCGGRQLTDGGRDRGCFVSPAVLTDVHDGMRCMREETFGPVLPVVVVNDRAEAVRRANASPYGLAAYLFTRDLGAAFEVGEALEAGTVAVNDSVPSTTIAPFGGLKMSGIGRECGREGIEAFLETKHLSILLGES